MARLTALQKRYGASKASVLVLLFPRDAWSLEEALLWASLHGFSSKDYDTKQNHYRVKQPGSSKKPARARTMRYAAGGIRAVVGWK
jgi:hypothetical protein